MNFGSKLQCIQVVVGAWARRLPEEGAKGQGQYARCDGQRRKMDETASQGKPATSRNGNLGLLAIERCGIALSLGLAEILQLLSVSRLQQCLSD